MNSYHLLGELSKSAARGDQLLKLIEKLYRNSPKGAPSGPAAEVLGFFGNRGTTGRRVVMNGSVPNMARSPDKLDSGYFNTVFGDTKNVGSAIEGALSEVVPEARHLTSHTSKLLLENLANRQPLRDMMAGKVKNFRKVVSQGAKKPQLTSDTIAIP